jgi:hypothetical protein
MPRIASSTLTQSKPLSKQNISKGLIPNNFKKFNPNISDEFINISDWQQIRGAWSSNGTSLSTGTPSSSYPIISNLDLRSQNITATMSLDSAGPGVAFWIVDENNWWAASTYYVQSSESYITGEGCNEVANARCWGIDANGKEWGCTRCVVYYNYGTRTRYDFYIKLLNSVNGVVSDLTNVLLRSTCGVSTSWSGCTASLSDNISAILLTVSDDSIIIQGKDDANNLYGSAISIDAKTYVANPNKGYRSGVIFIPGSNYLESSVVGNISIVGS